MSRNRLLKVLDLGCGKRGDMYKYRNHNSVLQSYYGVDIAEDCVDNLEKIHGQMRRDYRRKESPVRCTRTRTRTQGDHGSRTEHASTAEKPFFDGYFLCADMTATDLFQQLTTIKLNSFFNVIFLFDFS